VASLLDRASRMTAVRDGRSDQRPYGDRQLEDRARLRRFRALVLNYFARLCTGRIGFIALDLLQQLEMMARDAFLGRVPVGRAKLLAEGLLNAVAQGT
jgi:hypothetical protein